MDDVSLRKNTENPARTWDVVLNVNGKLWKSSKRKCNVIRFQFLYALTGHCMEASKRRFRETEEKAGAGILEVNRSEKWLDYKAEAVGRGKR